MSPTIGVELAALFVALAQDGPAVGHLQGALVGEVRAASALLQTRLTAAEPGEGGEGGNVPGAQGLVLFELSTDPAFPAAGLRRLGPLRARAEHDHVVRMAATDLLPGTCYHWRVRSGSAPDALRPGPRGSFRTLPGRDASSPVSFAVVTGMNYHRFHVGDANRPAYAGEDRALGYPALEAIGARRPDFVVFTGDSVYYDTPQQGRATTLSEMRCKWHEQLAQPRFHALFAAVPTYWMKDDHDHRFNDCDTAGDRPPASDLGMAVFREQVPVVPQGDGKRPTWRTLRVSKELQLWLVEGRDHRSPNAMQDGPEKTLWGAEQLAWLQETLLASDASYRLLLSPTPLVGPDDGTKRDNHTNPRGFRHEGEAFLAWVAEHGLHEEGFLVLCGDRHWQYHSLHPSGVEELSCGALVDANARLGRVPGDPRSTDPEGLVRQLFSSPEATGGFLAVSLSLEDRGPVLVLEHCDETGRILYRVER